MSYFEQLTSSAKIIRIRKRLLFLSYAVNSNKVNYNYYHYNINILVTETCVNHFLLPNLEFTPSRKEFLAFHLVLRSHSRLSNGNQLQKTSQSPNLSAYRLYLQSKSLNIQILIKAQYMLSNVVV